MNRLLQRTNSTVEGAERAENAQRKAVFLSASPRRPLRLFFLLSLTAIFLVAGCAPTGSIGPRAADNPAVAVEGYLQEFQPGVTPRLFQTSRIYDRNGVLLAELSDEGRRTWVSLDRISPFLIQATIATEDATFYSNTGVDPFRIAGAALQNAQEGGVVSGASTITMQLARNLFLGYDQRYDQNMDRKVLEAGLAADLTTLYTKDEILEMYLNLLNYGHLTYGPEAAAQTYFGKSAADLTLAEASLLAGIPQQPANLDLFENFDDARDRQWIVLSLMVRHGLLAEADAYTTFDQEIVLNPDPDRRTVLAPHFVQYVRDTLNAKLGPLYLERAGLNIYTTLDLSLQDAAQAVVAERVATLREPYDLNNAALVAMRPGSGEILAMVGSADFNDAAIDGQVNVAVSLRQPGSAIKPILYATALNDNLISPATVLWDVPVTYTVGIGQPEYRPRNYDNRFHGPVTVRTALANSYNIPAVKLLDGVTVPRMLESARNMGLTSLNRESNWYGLSLTLGGGEVTALDLTTAFQTLANGGQHTGPRFILTISDSQGLPMSDPLEAAPTQVISPAAAFQITDMLSDNVARTPAFGANSNLVSSRPAAAKTGTTSDFRDNWTVGYNRYLVVGVWAGNSDGHPMRNTSGLTGAAPIWQDFMETVLANPDLMAVIDAPSGPEGWAFEPPAEVERRKECPPGLACPAEGEYFSKAWLDATGAAGPLADSVEKVASAGVFVPTADGNVRRGYCTVATGATRSLLRLPAGMGLPQPTPEGAAPPELAPNFRTEQGQVIGFSLRNGNYAVNLGPCEGLAGRARSALALSPQAGDGDLTVLVDFATASNPDGTADSPADETSGESAIPVEDEAGQPIDPGQFRFILAQPVGNTDNCPGNYIMGQVLNWEGGPIAGIQLEAVDQWGNRATAVSKSGATDYGLYDFPILGQSLRYTVRVLDGGGNPISPPVVIDHLQGDGSWPCHWVVWRGG
ncbi:MAG: transglycosylase domain-containing protein [Caldilineaceae bacterium]|nr:transglycosylase domain-containing protein [Caldilineaceae bacterium]